MPTFSKVVFVLSCVFFISSKNWESHIYKAKNSTRIVYQVSQSLYFNWLVCVCAAIKLRIAAVSKNREVSKASFGFISIFCSFRPDLYL